MTEVYTILSEDGDEYKLQFTTERSGIIEDELLDYLNSEGLDVAEIGLGRIRGGNVTNIKVLYQIEDCVADFMQRHRNVMLNFFCDFINFLPATKKSIPVQEYRSRLFEVMFNRYVSQHRLNDFSNKIVEIDGLTERFYFHVISRKEHLKYAEMIAEGHRKDFGKPE